MLSRILAVASAAAVLTAGCGGSDSQAPADSPASRSTDQALVEKLEAEAKEAKAEARDARAAARRERAAARKARAEARQEAARRRRARERRQAAAAAVTPEPVATSGDGGIVVPDVAGLDHQAAQDALQGEGLWVLDERDCTGQGRMLLFDRNWEVVSTDPPAGTPVGADTVITLCSVKQGEA